jgi:hypothetical protein
MTSRRRTQAMLLFGRTQVMLLFGRTPQVVLLFGDDFF